MITIIIILLGLIVGSFLNCLIYRLEKGEGFLKGRSYCPLCQHALNWQDLIPVLSFLILLGKCRYCQKRISWQYPLVEISTGLLFTLIFATFGWPLSIFYFLISIFLVIIFVYDLKHYLIPDKVIYPAVATAGIYHLIRLLGELLGEDSPLQVWRGLSSPALSAFGAAAFFLAIVLLSRGRWMGAGDIKLAFLMGLILGFPNILVALFLAFFWGAIIGVGLIISGKKNLKSEVPFGPFLIAGTFFALFWGEKIMNWYLNLF